VSLRLANSDDAGLLAAMHRSAFEDPWGEAEIGSLLGGPGGFALIAEAASGFILCRAVGGEAEILTLAVEPHARRRGLAKALVEAAAKIAQEMGAEALFLEVAEDNTAAIALYRSARFSWAGRRPGYYRRDDEATDALVMRRWLNRIG
jgi:ribosomal-protein-alanine N-acetyltransferase